MNDPVDQSTSLIIFGIIAIIIEVIMGAALGFELLVLGVIMILGGVVVMLSGSFIAGVISMIILLLAYVFFARKMIKKSLHITTHATNADSIIGKKATVTTEIAPENPGQVKIDGEIWRAEADTIIAKGEKVTIESISGVTVRVK